MTRSALGPTAEFAAKEELRGTGGNACCVPPGDTSINMMQLDGSPGPHAWASWGVTQALLHQNQMEFPSHGVRPTSATAFRLQDEYVVEGFYMNSKRARGTKNNSGHKKKQEAILECSPHKLLSWPIIRNGQKCIFIPSAVG